MWRHAERWAAIAVVALCVALTPAPVAQAQGGGVLVLARDGRLWAVDHRSAQNHVSALFSAPGAERFPAVSVDGKVAFDRQVGAAPRTVFVASPGTTPQPLVTGIQPTFSTFGGRIAFARGGGLFTIRVSGERLRRVTARRGDRNPHWGTNGLIAFERTRGREPGIYVVRPDGSELRRVVWSSLPLADPVWSPDAMRLLIGFQADGDRCREITGDPHGVALDAETTGEFGVILTSANGCAAANAWAPGGGAVALAAGRHLAFHALAQGAAGLICNAAPLEGVAWASRRAAGWLVGEATRGGEPRWPQRRCPGVAAETEVIRSGCRDGRCDRARHTATVCVRYHGKKYCWTVKR